MADVGRPTVMTPEAIAKLEEAFLNGASDLQACFLANISKDSLYDYQKLHPEFSERKQMLKDDTKMKAKMSIRRAIESEEKPETAKWLLERTDRDFKPKSDLTSDNKAFPQPILSNINDIPSDNSSKEDKGVEETA